MSNEEETQLELKTPEDESESDSDSDDEPLSYSQPRGTTQETGPDDSDSENTAESNIRCFTKVLNSKRLRKEREAEEEDYVYHEDLFNFPKDPENWREEDWKELRGDAPICHCRLLLSLGDGNMGAKGKEIYCILNLEPPDDADDSYSISAPEHQGNDTAWVWHAVDFADGELHKRCEGRVLFKGRGRVIAAFSSQVLPSLAPSGSTIAAALCPDGRTLDSTH
ncbi:TIC 100 [Olea europaea subsp. europaea]|uniref:TIC 100 n=1 Tax=Olea europaea subsp. europaea TaxID=158383 RepID=A0A8S0VLH4_OLEEU|nr:TIC 100 [Olea europaea subsp. europaea]